jgi:hypothetical protein
MDSREVPLPLIRGEIVNPSTNGNGFPYPEGWRLRYPVWLRRAGDVDVYGPTPPPLRNRIDLYATNNGVEINSHPVRSSSSDLNNTTAVINDPYYLNETGGIIAKCS